MPSENNQTVFDADKAEAFSEKLLTALNYGSLSLMMSIGHRTGIFDAMRALPPSTSEEVAEASGLNERYVREWLGAMVTAGVIDVDPTSTRTGGSILGDKTRMERLAREPNCFIRPSPSGGHLGGVTRKSRETLLLCEAAGFDVILIETVGVGQSEITVRSMVDFFLLLALTGAGDELQGIKKGVIELADAIVINKADGDNKLKAENTRREYANALHYLHPATDGWTTKAGTCSSLNGTGIPEVWTMIGSFRKTALESGVFEKRRQHQLLEWMQTLVLDELQARFLHHPSVARVRQNLEDQVAAGTLPVATAVEKLLEAAWPNST